MPCFVIENIHGTGCIANLVDQIDDGLPHCVSIVQYCDGVLVLFKDHVPNHDGELVLLVSASHRHIHKLQIDIKETDRQ